MTSPTPADLLPGDTATLDRRRGKAQAAKDAADKARGGVADLDTRIAANASQTQQDQAALHRARDEVIRLKRALKAAAKEGVALQARRKKASTVAVKADAKAKAAETKYDQAVLADIVRREKARDRTAAATAKPAAPAPTAATPAKPAAPAPTAAAPAKPIAPTAPAKPTAPTAERPDARPQNAARKTAAKAAGTAKGEATPNAS